MSGDMTHLEAFIKKIPAENMTQILMHTDADGASLLLLATASRRLSCISLIMDKLNPADQLKLISQSYTATNL